MPRFLVAAVRPAPACSSYDGSGCPATACSPRIAAAIAERDHVIDVVPVRVGVGETARARGYRVPQLEPGNLGGVALTHLAVDVLGDLGVSRLGDGGVVGG